MELFLNLESDYFFTSRFVMNMGFRYDGPVCVECNTLIEGSNAIRCSNCHALVHNNEQCLRAHRSKCMKAGQFKKFSPPDFRDILK